MSFVVTASGCRVNASNVRSNALFDEAETARELPIDRDVGYTRGVGLHEECWTKGAELVAPMMCVQEEVASV